MINPPTASGVNRKRGTVNITEIISENLSFIDVARSLTALVNYVGVAQHCANNLSHPKDDLLVEFLDKAAHECEEARSCVHEAYSPDFGENNSHCSGTGRLNPGSAGGCISST